MYWNINRSLSYNSLFHFIVGNRGAGKTYGFKKYAINDFLKTGRQFIYTRRYEKELKKTIGNFFNDIKHEFPDDEFSVKGDKLYINKELAGWGVALSTAKILKSNSFPNVNKIGFDEFILDKGHHRYLSDEVINFLEFYETVARTREDVRVWFLSNAITMSNPYFSFFKARVRYDKDIYLVKKDILIEFVANEDFIKMKKATRFGGIIDGTQYANYSINNEFLRDNNTFVSTKTDDCELEFIVKYRGKEYGSWVNINTGMMYFSNKFNPNFGQILSFTTEDHSENTFLMKSNSFAVRQIRERFKHSMVRFETINIKNEILPLLEKIL